MINRRSRINRNIFVIMFQLSVILNAVLGSDEKLNIIPRGVMLFFFALMFVRLITRGAGTRFTAELFVPVLFLIYMCVSTLWARNVSTAGKQLWTQVQLFALFFFTYSLMLTEGDTEDYFNALYVSGYGLMIYALIKYGGPVGYFNAIWDVGRVGGEITNENTFGKIFSDASIIAAYKAVMCGRKKHWISFALFAFFAFSSGSKKAILMIAAGIVGILILHYGIRKVYKALIGGGAAVGLGYILLRLPMFSVAYNRLDSFLAGSYDVSDQRRQNMISEGLRFFRERPIFGYGLNNFRVLYFEDEYSHNNFIEVMVSLGVIGLLLYYLMYLIPTVKTIGLIRAKDPRVRDCDLILLFMLAISFVFGIGMVQFYSKDVWVLLGVALAMTARFNRNDLGGIEA